jgi:hypothetical protein
MEGLNINQLKEAVQLKIADNEKFLNGNIRVIGLREKVIRRQKTLNKVLTLLSNHSDIHIVSDTCNCQSFETGHVSDSCPLHG